MASLVLGRRPASFIASFGKTSRSVRYRLSHHHHHHSRRSLQTSAKSEPQVSDFAFAFDIDGVLLRSANPLPRAHQTLQYLQKQRIPFILLTNGGGKSEEERVADLSKSLDVPLDTSMFVQSHTPFAELVHDTEDSGEGFKDKCILVTGGDGDKCRKVAEGYGFTNVLTPADLITTFPALWPFASPQNYTSYAQTIPNKHLSAREYVPRPNLLKVDAIFIFNDPRDWALDTQIILDLLLSHSGHLGSLSSKNGNPNLPNNGYLQDSQPPLYFSNPDLFWAAAYHLPRLGQGGFREALGGVWKAVTGGARFDVRMFGKPYQPTFAFAARRLQSHRQMLLGQGKTRIGMEGLKRVYMVGDNPESDILGANQYQSEVGSEWNSILVRSGVYSGGEPAHKPKAIVEDVWEAVQWGLEREGMRMSGS